MMHGPINVKYVYTYMCVCVCVYIYRVLSIENYQQKDDENLVVHEDYAGYEVELIHKNHVYMESF